MALNEQKIGDNMDYIEEIRKLARSTYYQNIYSSSKELGSIHIFENIYNFSGIQVLFLFWLEVYSNLYSELSQKKWKYLDEKVIENDIRCDAFLYWRKQQNDIEIDKQKREQQINNLKLKDKSNVSTFNVDFSG